MNLRFNIAGMLLPAFFIIKLQVTNAQQLQDISFTIIDEFDCGNYNANFVEKDVPFIVQINDKSEEKLKLLKLKSKTITIQEIDQTKKRFKIVAHQTGELFFKAQLNYLTGKKFKLVKSLHCVELPVLRPEIVVTSPDSKFMWLNLIDVNTGQVANSSFELCQIDFVLKDQVNNIKEEGICQKDDDFFPSVTLKELPSKFSVNDKLNLKITVVHYEFKLPVIMEAELTIRKIWN